MDTPFYHLVKKDLAANLKQRHKWLRMGHNDESARRSLYSMCARDPLFWLNAFGWTYDPRLKQPVVPFITYEYQDETIGELDDAIDIGDDRLIEKSRDMGASWMILAVYTHRWNFRPYQSFLLVSRKEDLVDKTGDPKSLFWKIDFLLDVKRMPRWLLPNMTRNKLHLANDDNGSVIDGESTTGDVARGDRRTGIMLDEFASVEEACGQGSGHRVLRATRDTTQARAFNSTPKGQGNAFCEQRDRMLPQGKVITLHWPRHPVKAAGLYIDENSANKGRGENRGECSPWYDNECDRAAHPMEIAQELDIDYLGSDFVFFDLEDLRRIRAEFCVDPFTVGELDYDHQSATPSGWTTLEGGRLKLWINLEDGAKPPPHEYIVSADVATGTGASNSAIVIGDATTGEKIGVFKTPFIRPEELGRFAVAVARFFNDALLIWEANGPGRNFGDAVIEAGYRNVWYRRNEQSLSKKQSDTPGWFSTKENKRTLLGDYRRALKHDHYINRSREGIVEAQSYVFTQGQSVEHSRALLTEDPSAARDNHGDEVIADALNWRGMKTMATVQEAEPEIPVGSFMDRRRQREAAKAAIDYW